MKTPFNQNELPVEGFKRLGLYQNDSLNLTKDNLNALLSGRRTDLIAISDLKVSDFTIKHLDAKLSLVREDSGAVELLIHPIYKEVRKHTLLSEFEAEQLINGNFSHLEKEVISPDGKPKSRIIEYDAETKEFISYDPEDVIVPDKVNGERLTAAQKESFKRGDVVELSDGTQFQHRTSDAKGIVSDNKMLLVSMLLDGGISYLLIKGISNLAGSNSLQKEQNAAFEKALQLMEVSPAAKLEPEVDLVPQQSRGYGRNQAR